MTTVDPTKKLREQIDGRRLSGDRLREAQAVLSRQLQSEDAERKRKNYGAQLAVLFFIVVVALGGVTWAFQKLIGAGAP